MGNDFVLVKATSACPRKKKELLLLERKRYRERDSFEKKRKRQDFGGGRSEEIIELVTNHCGHGCSIHCDGESGAENPHREQPDGAVQRHQPHHDDRGKEADVHAHHHLRHLHLQISYPHFRSVRVPSAHDENAAAALLAENGIAKGADGWTHLGVPGGIGEVEGDVGGL